MARPNNGSPLKDNQVDNKQLLAALTAFKRGDFSARLPDDWTGLAGKIADTFNDVIATNERMTRELERIGRVVGKQGKNYAARIARRRFGFLGGCDWVGQRSDWRSGSTDE